MDPYIFLIALKNHPDGLKKSHYSLIHRTVQQPTNRSSAHLDFDEKLATRRYEDHGALKRHQAVAARLDVVGTPTYFLSGKRVNGAKVKELEQLLGGETIPFDVEGESPYSQ